MKNIFLLLVLIFFVSCSNEEENPLSEETKQYVDAAAKRAASLPKDKILKHIQKDYPFVSGIKEMYFPKPTGKLSVVVIASDGKNIGEYTISFISHDAKSFKWSGTTQNKQLNGKEIERIKDFEL